MSILRTVLLVCGGRSPEHEISLESCLSVFNAIDRTRYIPCVVGITKLGVWKYYGDSEFAADTDSPNCIHLIDNAPTCFLGNTGSGVALHICGQEQPRIVDVAFPVLHGAFGEDGTIQGLFQMVGLPYVGCDVESSAVCMDKAFTKKVLDSLDIYKAPSITLLRTEGYNTDTIADRFDFPVFVKPTRTGSSVGISKVKDESELSKAIEKAFEYDDKILIEEAVIGREIECGVLQRADGSIFIARPGEVVPHADFYSYEAKYIDENGATIHVQADLSAAKRKELRELATEVFNALGCSGMARIDFFFTPEGNFIFNEVNTIPGFTSISLYPQMMENSGIKYADLISELIENAIYNYRRLNARIAII